MACANVGGANPFVCVCVCVSGVWPWCVCVCRPITKMCVCMCVCVCVNDTFCVCGVCYEACVCVLFSFACTLPLEGGGMSMLSYFVCIFVLYSLHHRAKAM